MEEEHKKIRNHTVYMQNEAYKQQNDAEAKQLIPCDFLRFVANFKDDLEHLAFQLDANHVDNFPEFEVAKIQEKQQERQQSVRESIG